MFTNRQRPDGRWCARYRNETGREHARHFARKVGGQRWLDEVTTSMVTAQFVDPNAGKVTFSAYFADWASRRVRANGTERAMSLAANSVQFGDVPLRSIRRSHVEAWVKAETSRGLGPGTIATRHNNVRPYSKPPFATGSSRPTPPTGWPLPGDGGTRQP